MLRTVATLMDSAIDFAGLFPPAKMQMTDAIEEYLNLINGTENWIVNRFVCPATRLDELGKMLSTRNNTEAINLAVVSQGGLTLDTFETILESDAKLMNAFSIEFGQIATIEALELKVPTDDQLPKALKDLGSFSHIDVFAELPTDQSGFDGLAEVAATEWIGAKGRSGGIEPAMVPTSMLLAGFLKTCLDLQLRFKLTAGLHEPVRHFDKAVGTDVHGFGNVIGACLFHSAFDLSTSEIAEILERSELSWFEVSDDRIRIQNQDFSIDDLEEFRGDFEGFGSCSIQEPLEGMAKLGWLRD